MMKQLTGAQIVLECLKEQGVDTVFGYPGGAILNIYDELYKQKKDFTHILTSHEQGASHAADGYAPCERASPGLLPEHNMYMMPERLKLFKTGRTGQKLL